MKELQVKEEYIHLAIAEYLSILENQGLIWYSTVENSNQQGGWSGKRKQVILRRKGMKAGFPDIIVFKKLGNKTEIIFLEVKAQKGRLTESQKKLFPELERYGALHIVRSVDDVIKVFELCRKWK